jgi:hypothetical protein
MSMPATSLREGASFSPGDSFVENRAPSRKLFWIGWILSALPALLLIFSAVMKFIQPEGMDKDVEKMGWPMRYMTALGVVELLCAIIYLIPATSVLGAILVTGYLGGAIATHARIGDPALVSGLIVGIVVWLGIFLREPRLRKLIPLRI